MKKVFLVLVDISGYTRFMKLHRISLIHAERIIGQLLESVIRTSTHPLVTHELEGDAVTFYAVSDGTRRMAADIGEQVLRFFDAFKAKERELVSDCSLCVCDACAHVGKLRLKAVVHHGEAVFSKVGGFRKVAGMDVILAHRLLKNTIDKEEYVLTTSAFDQLSGGYAHLSAYRDTQQCEGIGPVEVVVYDPGQDAGTEAPLPRSIWSKLMMSMKNDLYLMKRLVGKSSKSYRHLNRRRE